MEKLLKVKDVCELLSVSKSTLYDWVHVGIIPHIIIKRNPKKQVIRFKPSELEQWINTQERETINFMKLDKSKERKEVK